MLKNYLIIANWKMNLDFNESTNFVKIHGEDLIKLSTDKNIDLVICPSYPSLYTLSTIFDETPIKIGSQNCSRHIRGNFTGQVSAKNLHQIGCSYCIIGHSETRLAFNEADEDIIEKFIHLLDYDISPIVCIGETKEEYTSKATLSVVKKQLNGIFKALRSTIMIPKYLEICIAYEPIWSIGTGVIPDRDHLEMVFGWIKSEIQKVSTTINFKLIYGGSVEKNSVEGIKAISNIDGFLVGRASLDFNQVENIVDKLVK
ncbi:triose-phosphate isomerase [Candidatus Babeliales bacterium]|nr:triose-phosphate isomerase [Candidatus Babeliales bacterium]